MNNELPQVFVARQIPSEGLDILQQHCDVTVWPERMPPSEEDILNSVGDVRGILSLLTDDITDEVMDAAPKLEVVSNYAVGYDNVDVDAATDRDIVVTNTPGVLTDATADFTFALLMATARRIVEADHAVRSGEWLTWEPEFLLGSDIHDASLGIIGFGRIGQAVAKRARGFDMKIRYYDTERNRKAEDEYDASYADLVDVMRQSDFISVHLPLTEDTYHLLGTELLSEVKQGSVLINTARGEIIDEEALIDALNNGPLAAAGLDVFEEEPLPAEHPLTEMNNAILAPHLGSASFSARSAMAVIAAKNLVAVLQGQTPEHAVNPEVLK